MAYPERVDRFSVKLDKKSDGGTYAVEEELTILDGRYEGYLAHDNISSGSVRVYTGPKFTGDELTTWTLSTPAAMPWRRYIRVFADRPVVYASYETPGDTVDADDMNVLQEAVTATQMELERFKKEGVIDGGTFVNGE